MKSLVVDTLTVEEITVPILGTTEEKQICEKCGSKRGYGIYCTSHDCGCGALKYWNCYDCGTSTSYYHITKKGKEVLRVLLDE